MRMKIIIMVLLGISFGVQSISLNDGLTSVSVNKVNESTLSFNVNISEISFDELSKNNETFTRILMDNSFNSGIVGSPELPTLNRLIDVPIGADIEIEIVAKEQIDYNLIENNLSPMIYPTQRSISKSENPDEIEFVKNENVYNQNKFVVENIVEAENKGTMRSINISNIIISPFNYNPEKGQLSIYKSIDFLVHFNNADIEATSNHKDLYYSPYFEPIFKSQISNYTSSTRNNDLINDKVTYVIVANQIFEEELQDFIEWKTEKGYNVVTGYTNEIGSSSSAIRSFILDLYNNPSLDTPAPSFVLLVGDTQQLPASYSSGGHVSDLNYCDFTGDNMPEILHGRFSASTPTQLRAQVDKTLMYEKYEFPDPSFLADVIMISGVDANYAPTYGNGQINYGNNYYFNSSHGINSNTFLYPQSGSSGNQILNLADQGAAFMNYTAHGWESGWADPEFDLTDANNMTNINKYPTMVGNCCLTNAFDSGTCFGEALLRKADAGAIGYIGGSDVTYWNEDYWWGVGNGSINSNPSYGATGEGAYDGMFHEGGEENWAIVNSAIMFMGNLAVAEANGMDDYYWEIYHLMGDPSLSTYFGIPDENNVNHDAFAPIGTEAIEIQADPFSYVGISKDGILLGSGTVDEFGFVVIILENQPTDPGMMDVVITAQNKEPYFGEILIASPDGEFVTVNNVEISSNNILQGDVVELNISVENLGNESSDIVELSLFEDVDSPYISIINGSEIIDSVEENEIATVTLSFSVSMDAPFGHTFTVQLDLNSNENQWSNIIDMTVSPLLESFESGTFSDLDWQPGGNAFWSVIDNDSSDGFYSSKSGSIDHNMTSDLAITMDVVEDGFISFYKKVSCEDVGSFSGTYYDYLAFYIDGVEQNKWAGEVSWSNTSFPVAAGEHTFLWKFVKDQGVTSGQDAVWIDGIIFPPVSSGETAMLGDLNGDDVHNVLDIIILVNMIIGVADISTTGDMNQDGTLNVLDVILLVNIIIES